MADGLSFRIVHNCGGRCDEPSGTLGDSRFLDIQKEMRRAIAKLRATHEILASLTVSHDDSDSIEELLQDRADELGAKLTRTELEVIAMFIEGHSTEAIAEERGISARTIGNQLRTGCHKLGFNDRRELIGWCAAVRTFVLIQPPRTE